VLHSLETGIVYAGWDMILLFLLLMQPIRWL
jgi:hypothetical protein